MKMSTRDVEEDADQELSTYRQKLVTLDSELDSENVTCLKYLCFDVIPASKLEKITQGTDLFGLLEQKGALGNGNFYFLAECLSKICRLDLAEYLLDPQQLKISIEKYGSKIPLHRSLWFDISEELDTDEVCKCLYYYGNIPKSKRSGIKSGIDFLFFLEKMKKIRHDNMDYLVDVLRTIERNDLVEIIQKYEGQSSKSSPFRPIYRPPPPSAAGQEFDDVMDSFKAKEKEKELFDDEDEDKDEQMSVETMVTSTVTPPSYSKTPSQEISMPLQIQLAYEISSEPTKIPDFGKALGLSQKDIVKINTNNSKRPDMKVLEMMRLAQSEESGAEGENKVNGLMNALSQSGFGELSLKCQDHLLKHQEGAVKEPNVTNPPPQSTVPLFTVSETRNYSSVPSHTDEHKNIYVSSGEARALGPGEDVYLRREKEAIAEVIPPAPLLEKYRMNRCPRGVCVIFNNENFTYDPSDREAKRMNNRIGSSIDRDKLVTTFTELGFIVQAFNDLKDVEMVRVLSRLSLQDHSQFDCFVCVILSHGSRDHIYGANGRSVPIRTLADPLKNCSCPELSGKPKLFFIQACQGQDKQHGQDIQRDSVPGDDLDEDAPVNGEVLPNEQDFLIGMATVPGFVSYRSKTSGSWYIIKLCEALQQYAKYWDILHILTYVNSEVGKANADIDGIRYKQSPGPLYTLRKRLIFEPFE